MMTQTDKYKGVLVTGEDRERVIEIAEQMLVALRDHGFPAYLAINSLVVAMGMMIAINSEADDERELAVRMYADHLRIVLELPRKGLETEPERREIN
jgi:hypothetical protein